MWVAKQSKFVDRDLPV